MSLANDHHLRRELAEAFSKHRTELAEALFLAVKEPECSAGILPRRLEELNDWGQALYLAAINLATAWLRTPDELNENLFLGLVSQLKCMVTRPEEMDLFSYGKVLEFAKLRSLTMLEAKVSALACQALGNHLGRLIESLAQPVRKRLRVMFFGDCLALEIMAILANPCAQAQVGAETTRTHVHMQ